MKKTAVLGMYLAFAMILSYIEVLIPLPIPIPGIKLGLANLAIILILYLYGFKEALLINVVRIILMGLLFTNVSMILYSLAGGLLSLACMGLAKKAHGFGIQCVSMIGGITHNLGQILVAFAVVRTYGVFYYVPFLLLAGSVTGWVIGMLEKTIEPRLRHYLQTEK